MRLSVRARARSVVAALVCIVLVLGTVPSAIAGYPEVAQARKASSAGVAARATSYAKTKTAGRAAARQLLDSTGAASLSLALVDGNRVVWQESFGYADRDSQTAPTASTMYGIGSVSKMFATVAAMKLVDQDLIELDDPVVNYIPEFAMASPGYRQITVRMLLNHSAGFPGSDYRNCMTSAPYTQYAEQTLTSLSSERLKHTPGSLSVYANDGFTVVEELVKHVTGKDYPDFVEDEIITPMGMTNTKFPLEYFADGSYAKAYTGDQANRQEFVNTYGSGGVYSTPSDLAKLAMMFMNSGTYGSSRILSAASVNQMSVDQMQGKLNPAPSRAVRYGLGWDSVAEPALASVGFYGWTKGGDSADYHADFTVAPGRKLAVICTGVAPLDSSKLHTLSQRIILSALAERGSISAIPKQVSSPKLPLKTPTVEQVAAVCGVYGSAGTIWRVTASPSRSLMLSRRGPSSWEPVLANFKLRSDGMYRSDARPSLGLRTVSAWGRRFLVLNTVGDVGTYRDDIIIGQKIRSQSALSEAWGSRMGKLWLVVNDTPYPADAALAAPPALSLSELSETSGTIVVLPPDGGPIPLDASVDDGTAYMFVIAPQFASRDQNDLVIQSREDSEWVRWGSYLCRPAEDVPALAEGPNTVAIPPTGYAEWRATSEEGTITVQGAVSWRLFTEDMGLLASGRGETTSVPAPEGAWLIVNGEANGHVDVDWEPGPVGLLGELLSSARKIAPHVLR